MTSMFGLCHYGSVPISTLLHFSSPSVFHSLQNFHFDVHFMSVHISLLSVMINCFNLQFLYPYHIE
jgi:hypothetical protein